MPEYLSPGVYVEEVNSGAKPIEGVSTSTAGMVGVTERGPENVPVLVTSVGDYRRVFGGELRLDEFTDGGGRPHAYLPHAVQGFFQNEGRRDYVVRVAPQDASLAMRDLFDRGGPASAERRLLRAAPQDSGTAINAPLLYTLGTTPVSAGDWVRVGEGSRAEYRQVAAGGVSNVHRHVALNFPLGQSHAAAAVVDEVVRTVDTTAYLTGDFQLAVQANAGATSITVTAVGSPGDATTLLGLPGNAVFEIGALGSAEYVVAIAADALGGGSVRLTLATPLAMGYAPGDPVNAIELVAPATTASLDIDASAGEVLLFLDSLFGAFAAGNLVVIDSGTAAMEVRRIGTLSQFDLDLPAYADYGAGTRFELVAMGDHSVLTVAAPPLPAPQTSNLQFYVDSVEGLAAGMPVTVGVDTGFIQSVDDVTLLVVMQATLPSGAPAPGTVVTPAAKALTGVANAGRVVLSLDNRLGLAAGDVLRIGTGADAEYATIASISGARGAAPDSGNLVLSAPLAQEFAVGTLVQRQATPVVNTARQPALVVLSGETGEGTFFVNDGATYAAGEVLRASAAGGGSFYHELADANPVAPAPAGLSDIQELTLEPADPLDFSHEAGSALVEREAVIEVFALDRGAWGNRLQVSVEDPETSLVQAQLTAANGLNPVISLSNYTNVEAGTVLEFLHPGTQELIGAAAKVVAVDRAAGEVELAAIPHADVITAHNVLPDNLLVRSREFLLSVYLLQRPDPAVPSRNSTVIDSERFLVCMDPRNSRYIHRVIGTTWVAGNPQDDDGIDLRLWDRRSEGESRYIRVRDVAAGNTAVEESIRLGPEVLTDELDSGQLRAARLPLAGGVDGLDSIIGEAQGDAMYLGVNSDEPRLRSGIHALGNVPEVSIVAVPGQTSVGVQQAVINHCENERYRFAVLDARAPDRDTLVDVQAQRQAFDTKYAALYHPWLTIPEPLPANLASIRQMPIPPSGHMMGIYARVDNTRGVHKAPANEVVRGITGLTRSLNQREQDILNPFPRNINVVRDFRESNRGLRVWGARCITSDSDYKYVNVRRLMIFLEHSLYRGLQWVVFEPNEEPLWARVRRAITNFLTVVWRNGALEGATVEQAFFVRCDRTTMTQTDLDNGRLICEIGVAPVKPAEFVIVRIGLWTASAD
ncbi:hypothetical protein E4634_01150 [Mangrovimicrobium sediminis]|uniref:Phage tail protein n=1 Tax=Mangrovimicrobium sediminis TaxID=2562682 RepID=A0A4Z0M9L7_9GAMM|nr:phage tail sheath C-terminal domain-containing protein [Haliea sp. SAOS-164]TGD76184.1 hypothetical protein E4634_01150 [Haliea sp. SAOS-164]